MVARTKGAPPPYTPAWIWGFSAMRAQTASIAEKEVFQSLKVLVTGGSTLTYSSPLLRMKAR